MKILSLLLLSLIAFNAEAQRRGPDPRLTAIIAMKDNPALQDTLSKLKNSKNENDLQLLVSYYNATRNTEKSAEITSLMKQRFPNGRAAFNELGERIYNERDPEVNEKNYREMASRFGSNPEFNLDIYKYYVAVTFLGKNKPQKVIEYLNMIKGNPYKTNAFSYAAREAIATKDYKLGETLIRKTFADIKGDTSHQGYDEFSRILSELLYENGKYQEGLPYAKRLYDKKSGNTGVSVLKLTTTYLHYLLQLNSYKEAYPLMVQQMKAGSASPLVKEKFKTAYVSYNGSESGLSELLANINKGLKEKIRAEVEKKMIHTAAYDFELRDLTGKTVKLSDFKGKVVVLDFWATWCAPCKASFPMMQEAVNKYKNDNEVAFLFIHTMETSSNATKAAGDYISDMKYTFKVLMDLKDPETGINAAASGYKVNGIPTKVVIDKEGYIRFQTLGGSAAGSDAFLEEMEAMISIAKG